MSTEILQEELRRVRAENVKLRQALGLNRQIKTHANLPAAVVLNEALSHGAKTLMAYLLLIADGPCLEIYSADLQNALRVSEDTIGRWVGELVDQGFLDRTRQGPYQPNSYTFLGDSQ